VVAQAKDPAFLPNPSSMTILGGFAPALLNNPAASQPTILNYELGTVAAYFSTFGAGLGPRHLVFNFDNDIYVLPSGITLVQKGPPVVRSATQNGNNTITISGAGLGSDSIVYFDGVRAVSQSAVTGTEAAGTLTVVPPQGVSSQVATVTVYNSDGQNSMLLQSDNPPTYLYPAAAAPIVTGVSDTALPAGSSAAVEINTSTPTFVDGQVTVGFGTPDVAVRKVWVLGPTRLIANVVVAPGAAIGASQISVISGLAIIPQAGTFQTQPVRSGNPFLALPVANGDPSRTTINPGNAAVLYGQNLAISPAAAQITVNEIPAQILFASATQINFLVPPGTAAGPATLRLNNGAVSAKSVIVQIDNPPPVITGINNASGAALPGISVTAGDVLNVLVTGLDAGSASRVRAQVSGLEMPIQQVVGLPNGAVQVQLVLTQSFGGAKVPVSILLDASASAPFVITVR
jgi:uncharacterized protein (TIGR03437 family)